jgi:hypothetical protein
VQIFGSLLFWYLFGRGKEVVLCFLHHSYHKDIKMFVNNLFTSCFYIIFVVQVEKETGNAEEQPDRGKPAVGE